MACASHYPNKGCTPLRDAGERYLPLPVHKLERNSQMRRLFITSFATLSAQLVLGLASVFAQSPFWQQTPLQTQSIIALVASKSGFVFAADYNGTGVYRSSDNGNTWVKVDSNLTNLWMRSLAIDSSGNVYAGSWGIYKSTDNGITWTYPDTGLPQTDILSIIVAHRGYLFATPAGEGIFRSTDHGASWDPVNVGLTNLGHFILSLAVDTAGDILAGTGGGLFQSTNDGESWKRMSLDSTSAVSPLLVLPNGWIYAGTSALGLCRSTDNGFSWETINMDNDFRAIAIAPSRQLFAAADDLGVSTSKDDGDTWTQINAGLTLSAKWAPTDFIWCLTVSPDGYIFAGAYQDGVFRSIQAVTSVRQMANSAPESFQLRQNYPNPFNPSTLISYQLASPDYVTLKVYDVLGREVATLVDERQTAGNHSITLSAATLPSGVYFYRLQAGTLSETQKLTVLK